MVEKLLIQGGRPLIGEVTISGAKNSAVALIPACILAEDTVVIENLPQISDVVVYSEILRDLGATVTINEKELTVEAKGIQSKPMPNGRVKKLRASYYLMGALLGRFGKATVGLPGGCNLGPRPIDQHIKGFEALGARVTLEQGAIHIEAEQLRGAKIYLDIVSHGATVNIMLAAAKAKGQTIIENASHEPEIVDLATLLNSMGAQIIGAGTDVIKINGVDRLSGCRHPVIPDRLEAGTFMIAAAATKGDVLIDNVIPKHLEPITAKLRELGIIIEEKDDSVRVIGKQKYESIDIKTLPYPGFPTDLQQPMTTLLTQAHGTSIVTDNIYSARFKHVDELIRMGGSIRTEGRSAIIEGGIPLQGSKVKATDLRAGAALVIAGLIAEGITEISGVEHIDRGYDSLESKLKALGAETWREQSLDN